MIKPAVLALLLLPALVCQAAPGRDPSVHFFNQSLGDFGEELQAARDEGKSGILIFFEMDECPFCHRMKQTVLNQPEVQDYFREHFLIFPVDIEGDVEIVDFQGNTRSMKDWAFKEYRVRATPVFAFFDLQGQLLTRYIGATTDADEFMLLGRYVVEGAYKDQSFTRYKRQQAN
ncbi:MAG: thioredoxin family protein [Chromatiales bacterium]|jgi:thioredoxin-related protein